MDYPRVTEVLRPFTSYDSVPPEILNRAAARGTTVHALCAGIAKDDWVPDGMIDPEHLGYVNSFRKWAKSSVQKFVVVEKRYCDEERRYTGQLDFVILGQDDKLYLVDLKTSARTQKTYPLQMAAYDSLLKNHKIEVAAALLVFLDKAGNDPVILTYEDLTEETYIFGCALECWHYLHKGKKT
jgi:hypothetical protein